MRAACRPTNRGNWQVTAPFDQKPWVNRKPRERNRSHPSGVQGFTRLCSQAVMSELERSLLRRLRDRDERAFRELVQEHRDRVYNITFRMLGNRAEAEDVAQEVFITVFKTIDQFRE